MSWAELKIWKQRNAVKKEANGVGLLISLVWLKRMNWSLKVTILFHRWYKFIPGALATSSDADPRFTTTILTDITAMLIMFTVLTMFMMFTVFMIFMMLMMLTVLMMMIVFIMVMMLTMLVVFMMFLHLFVL